MLAHVLKMAGHVVGQTSTDAVYIDGNVTVRGDMTGPVGAGWCCATRLVDIAVLETARGGIVRAGLGYRYLRRGRGAERHLRPPRARRRRHAWRELADVKRLVVEVAKDYAVLNADNEHTLKMAAHTQARHICYVTRDPDHPLVREHIRRASARWCWRRA